MSDSSRPEVAFSSTAQVRAGKLVVEYVLVNRSGRTIYVFDRPTRFQAGVVKVDPDRMFVLLSGKDEVRLLQTFVGLPELHDIRRRPPLIVSPVPPQAELRRTIALDLPLSENQQFYSANPAADPPVTVDRVRVQVGWVEERAGMTVNTLPIDGRDQTKLSGGWGKPTQWISEALLATPQVTVLRHVEPFERNPSLD